jgi:hypothetical protein
MIQEAPPNSRKVKTLKAGTVKLSKPMGERPSPKVPATQAASAGRIFPKMEKGYKVEKKSRLSVKLEKLARNIAVEPSKLLTATSL